MFEHRVDGLKRLTVLTLLVSAANAGLSRLPAAASSPEAVPARPLGSIGSIPIGDRPNETNSGVPSGTTLQNYEGGSPAAGAIVEGVLIKTTLRIAAKNVTIRNCRIEVSDYWGIDAEGSEGLTVDHCTFVGPDGGGNAAILTGRDATILACDVSGWQNGLVLQGGVQTVRGCYIHDLGPKGDAGEAHIDGISVQGGQNGVTIEGNVIYSWDTSCIFISTDFGPTQNVTVRGNWLLNEPGRKTAYPVYWGNVTGAAQMTNNMLERGSFGFCSRIATAQLAWTGNVTVDDKAIGRP